MKCVACGNHPLNYIHCDRWDCPLLVARAKIEGLGALGYRQAVTAILGGMPEDEDERDPDPPDEDDDEIAADWDENGYWPSENEETEEDEDA